MKIEPGIYRNCDIDWYHADPLRLMNGTRSLNQSTVKKLLNQSPMHAIYEPPAEDEETYSKAKAIGDATHSLIIGRGKAMAIADFDSWRTKEAKEAKLAAIVDGKTPILKAHFNTASDIALAARMQLSQHREKDCFTNGDGEVALIWKEGDLWFRCLVDWLHKDLNKADDLKTSAMSMAPHELGARAVDAGWDIQAAMIERGLNHLMPTNQYIVRRWYRFVALEQEPPYGLNVMIMTEHWLTMGRKKLQHAIDIWSQCMKTGRWPGYPTYPIYPDYPSFKETQWLNRESETLGENLNVLAAG